MLKPLRGRLEKSASVAISLTVHAAGLVVLSLLMLAEHDFEPLLITIGPAEESAVLDEIVTIETPDLLEGEVVAEVDTLLQRAQALDAPNIASPFAGPEVPGPKSTMLMEVADVDLLAETTPAASGGGFQGRDQKARGPLLAARGGTPQSENAVALGLQWLAAHQRESGAWRLNHQEGPCNHRCGNPGSFGSSTGATALALLPFLGANHCSTRGAYKEVVRKGIYFLESRMLETSHGGDLQQGSMYSQGVAAIALCENYALSGDPAHREAAQSAIDFICYAQHPKGGWRYIPGQPGDTTVTGWQVMALKSAKLAGLRVPSPVIEQAKSYLDGVQSADGALYGYLKRGKDPGPTAVGLLLRMYTGWRQDDERLSRGVDYLETLGPSDVDVYFNYYATQVMHHFEGPKWKKWNERVREHLIATQVQEGHARGSWYFDDKHNQAGGRLYTTAMSIMILEVYYRHMPLYEKRTVERDF